MKILDMFEQFYYEERLLTAEKKLLIALLFRTTKDFCEPSRRLTSKKNTQEAYTWFFSGQSNNPFSFTWVCLQLNIDPEKYLTYVLNKKYH